MNDNKANNKGADEAKRADTVLLHNLRQVQQRERERKNERIYTRNDREGFYYT